MLPYSLMMPSSLKCSIVLVLNCYFSCISLIIMGGCTVMYIPSDSAIVFWLHHDLNQVENLGDVLSFTNTKEFSSCCLVKSGLYKLFCYYIVAMLVQVAFSATTSVWFLNWITALTESVCILHYSQIGQWHVADEYNGQVREITFRSLCHSPMCPPDTAMTEWQHAVLSADKTNLVSSFLVNFVSHMLFSGVFICSFGSNYAFTHNILIFQVFETVQQVHDVPFGSFFEVLTMP